MDVYDGLWFPDGPPPPAPSTATYADASPTTACLSSPSSGYSSADEGRVTPVADAAGWDVDVLSSDPYLGDLAMTPGGCGTSSTRPRPSTDAAAAAVTATSLPSSWSGCSLVLDDFVDTLWDSLAASPPTSPANGNIRRVFHGPIDL